MSERQPQILVNGERQDEQVEAWNAVKEQIDSVGPEDGNAAEDKETQAKMQSVFQQVRDQIRSQVGMKAKSSIVELVRQVRDRETGDPLLNNHPDDNNKEKRGEEPSTREGEMDGKGDIPVTFEEKLEACKKALKEEFEQKISQVRKEMQAYTDQALRDMGSKLQSHSLHQARPKPLESRGPDKKQQPTTAPSMASRRGRVLTRTMTTIIPKTCLPVIVGPRAKSETLSSSKVHDPRRLSNGPDVSSYKQQYNHRRLPPTCPPLHQHRKLVQTKTQEGH
ncbi:uncharacterized protein LOC143003543 [Genypterus blacodes]|uniref:uncharacterized protein LOC143003543 n=1 Tax=Genypterus blacodes TaxID=154954 RepID=UPI003F76664D